MPYLAARLTPLLPVQLSVLKKALTQQTLDMTEMGERMRQVEKDLAEAKENARNARAAADAWKARLEEAEEAKRTAEEALSGSERKAEEAQSQVEAQSKVRRGAVGGAGGGAVRRPHRSLLRGPAALTDNRRDEEADGRARSQPGERARRPLGRV